MAGKGYEFGIAPPFRCSYTAKPCMGGNSSTEPYIVGHKPITLFLPMLLLCSTKKHGLPHRMAPGSGFVYIYPQGLQKLLENLKKRYQNPKIYTTENVISQGTIVFHLLNSYMIHFEDTMNGVDIEGYFYWSLHDSYERGGGIGARFGLYFVDYNDNLKRIPKESAKWLHDFLQSNATTSPAGSPAGSPSGSPKSSGTGANAKSSAGSSIKLSISHLFFLICAATVASTFTTY
ncbi:raucaffricine-o-beta-d-glucosidase [Quercus suber]|uniref:Raucaffricine-o-beta-d-glucosidase n=1 Tax=Quercus suber TaxID=58331 RepID=A0AAW0M7H2_QUESU